MNLRAIAKSLGWTIFLFFVFGGAFPLVSPPLTNAFQEGADSVIAKAVAGGCWSFEEKQTTSDKCPTTTKDTWFLCLNQTMGGSVQGTLNLSHSEMLEMDKLSPEDFTTCFKGPSSNAISMLTYDVSITKSAKNEVVLSETHHNCSVGVCDKLVKDPFKGKLGIDGETLLFARSNGKKLLFKKYQTKPEEKSN